MEPEIMKGLAKLGSLTKEHKIEWRRIGTNSFEWIDIIKEDNSKVKFNMQQMNVFTQGLDKNGKPGIINKMNYSFTMTMITTVGTVSNSQLFSTISANENEEEYIKLKELYDIINKSIIETSIKIMDKILSQFH